MPMPTPEQVKNNQLIKSQFLAELYDAEPKRQDRMGLSDVDQTLEAIGAQDMLEAEIALLVRTLLDAGMVEGLGQSLGEAYEHELRLTNYGRIKVEQWVIAGDRTTVELPVSYQTVYNTTIHGPQGTVVNVGSDYAQATINNQFGEPLRAVVAELRKILDDGRLDTDTAGELSDDLTLLEQQAATSDPNVGRIRRLLARAQKFVTAAVGAGVSAALTKEANDAVTDAIRLF